MSILAVNRLYTGRGGTDTHLNHRTYREAWEVLTDSIEETEFTVGNAIGLPQVGTAHPNDPTCYAVDVDASQSEESPFIWYVSVKYDSKPELPEAFNPDGQGSNPETLPENPLLRPAVWSIGYRTDEEVANEWYPVDAAGNLALGLVTILNSAKLPYDPPVTVPVSRPTIHVTKNIKTAELMFFERLQDAVNEKPWKGLAPRVGRISAVRGEGKFENGVGYVEVSIDIMLKGETWDMRLLDCGFMELTERSVDNTFPVQKVQAHTRMRDVTGAFPSSPLPLDGNGRKLAPGGTPVYRRGLPANYHLADFTKLLGI